MYLVSVEKRNFNQIKIDFPLTILIKKYKVEISYVSLINKDCPDLGSRNSRTSTPP